MPLIKNISQCLKLKSRSKNHYGKKINQNCSKKCSNSLKKGFVYKSYSKIPNLDIRDKPETICGYQIKNNILTKKNKKEGVYGDGGAADDRHVDIPVGTINITFEMWRNVGVGVMEVGSMEKREITSVRIPHSVKDIGNRAFTNFTSLREVTIPDSVTIIRKDAFGGCTSLEKIEIPNSVTEIGAYAFRDCRSLTSIEIPNSVTEIKEGSFWVCDELVSVIIPDSVTKIGTDAFISCSRLTQIVIPNSVTEIGKQAFRNCESISALVIPNSVTIIEQNTFYRCLALRNITIPSSVMEIRKGAFSQCERLNVVDYGKHESWPQAEAGIFSRNGFNTLNKFTRTVEIHKDLGNGDSCFVRCTWLPKQTGNPEHIGVVDTTGIISPIILTTLGGDLYEIENCWSVKNPAQDTMNQSQPLRIPQIKTLLQLAKEQHRSVFKGSRWCVAIEDINGYMHEFNPSNIDLNNIAFMAIQGEIILNNPWFIVWKDVGEECGGEVGVADAADAGEAGDAADGPRNNKLNYQPGKRKTRKRQSKRRQSKRGNTKKKKK